jgi:hypothetical protein
VISCSLVWLYHRDPRNKEMSSKKMYSTSLIGSMSRFHILYCYSRFNSHMLAAASYCTELLTPCPYTTSSSDQYTNQALRSLYAFVVLTPQSICCVSIAYLELWSKVISLSILLSRVCLMVEGQMEVLVATM